MAEAINPVTMTDGSVEDFGKNGQVKREFVFAADGVALKLKLITGIFKEVFIPKTNPSFDLLAARGAAEYLSNSIAGVYSDKEGLHHEDFELAVDQALSQLASGELSTRKASEDLKGYGDLIRALIENRQTATNEDGSPKFTEEQSSYAVVKALVLGASEDDNKLRMRIPSIAARIEGYKLERQAAKKAKADAKVVPVSDDLADLL